MGRHRTERPGWGFVTPAPAPHGADVKAVSKRCDAFTKLARVVHLACVFKNEVQHEDFYTVIMVQSVIRG